MIRVFEAFSGIGAQRMALRDIEADFKVIATSDIDPDAILSYYYVHHFNEKEKKNVNFQEKIKYLEKIGVGNKKKLEKIDKEKLNILYTACIVTNNLGDITKIDANEIPDHDLFTYSFPCQDISSVGTMRGLDKGSGTRSSLLWECRKVIEAKKPKYLLLENVKNLTTGKNKKNFIEWLDYLESQGYDNYWKIMDAKDYGIPQRRPRVIVVSKLDKSKTNLIKDNEINQKTIDDILDKNESKFHLLKLKAPLNKIMQENKYMFLDDRDWKINGTMVSDLCSTQRAGRSGLKCAYMKNGKVFARKLSALECCRLMGYKDSDYENLKKGNLSDGTIMKICGNSIVVNVLKNIFTNIVEEEKND